MRHLLSLADWDRASIEGALRLASEAKRDRESVASAMRGRTLLMLFEKASLRTRLSFEVAMLQMGGHAIFYDLAHSPWRAGKETPGDTSRTASRYVDAIMARLFRRADLETLAEHASVPVINGLTDLEHPCQALGDLMTLQERKGRLEGLSLTYLGDANNNVTHSLLDGCAKTGVHLAIACPRGKEFRPADEVLDRALRFARESGASIRITHDPAAAVAGADAVYTDTWMSYHIPELRREARTRELRPFSVTPERMSHAKPDAIFLHCLPAQRGVEVAAQVIDGPQSAVFDQAENRLHVEKAVLIMLLQGPALQAPTTAARR
ncbi:MAG TPA: ornithine carbamoyltransferase [Planctomycetota bacterium]|nr:ornithine carbamoyltransferase [Planctomycetota bacterium]